jgi:ABC-type xylose transport system permease subunit
VGAELVDGDRWLVAGDKTRAVASASAMNRFNRWARRWLWSWAVILGLVLLLAWLLGDWHSAYHIVQSILVTLAGACLFWLIIAGWIEWRRRPGGRQ